MAIGSAESAATTISRAGLTATGRSAKATDGLAKSAGTTTSKGVLPQNQVWCTSPLEFPSEITSA